MELSPVFSPFSKLFIMKTGENQGLSMPSKYLLTETDHFTKFCVSYFSPVIYLVSNNKPNSHFYSLTIS